MKLSDKTSKMSAVASDGEFWVSKILNTIRTLTEDCKHISLQINLEDDVSVHCVKAQELAAQLKTVG